MATDSFGSYLKQTRETQGLSLEQVASVTRIQHKYLQALEEEAFADLPEQVFTRGFVRTYARSLGMDEKDVLRRFDESSNEFYDRGKQEQHQVQLKIEEERRGKFNRNLVIIIIAVIVLGIGILLPRQQQPPPPSEPEPNASQSVSLPLVENIERETPPVTETITDQEEELYLEEAESPSLPEPPPPPLETAADLSELETDMPPSMAPTPDSLLLELEATQITWVVVRSDQNDPQEALLQPGQQTTWEAREQFTLTLGNAGGVLVRLNGESRGPFGKPGEVVREVILRN